MARWSQPVGLFILAWFVGGTISLLGLNIIDLMSEGPMVLVASIIAMIIFLFVVLYISKIRLGDLYDHERSFWNMEVDQVLSRLDAAMIAKGVNITTEQKGKRVWISLPPLSVVVVPGWPRTKIYVGPSHEDNELAVWKLKDFIERALAR